MLQLSGIARFARSLNLRCCVLASRGVLASLLFPFVDVTLVRDSEQPRLQIVSSPALFLPAEHAIRPAGSFLIRRYTNKFVESSRVETRKKADHAIEKTRSAHPCNFTVS